MPPSLPASRLRRGLMITLAVMVLAAGYGAYRSYLIDTEIYQATARIEIVQAAPGSALTADVEGIKKPEFLKEVVKAVRFDATLARRHGFQDPMPMDYVLGILHKIVHAKAVAGTHFIDITVQSAVAEDTAILANTIAESYVPAKPPPGLAVVNEQASPAPEPVRLVTRAQVPEEPSLPNHVYDIAFYFFLSIGPGIGLAILVDGALRLYHPSRKSLPTAGLPPPASEEY